MSLVTGPMGGISGGTQAIISFNYGAGKTDRVREAEKKILLMCVIFTVIMFTVSRFSAEAFARIFVSGADEIELAGWGIRTFTLAIIPLAFQYSLVDGLTAMGRTKTALFLSMFQKDLLCRAYSRFRLCLWSKKRVLFRTGDGSDRRNNVHYHIYACF